MKTTIQFQFITELENEITIEATIEEESGDYETPPVLPWVQRWEVIGDEQGLAREDWHRVEDRALSIYQDMI